MADLYRADVQEERTGRRRPTDLGHAPSARRQVRGGGGETCVWTVA